MDVAATVTAVLESAKHRKFFWVFLDHQMTAGPLEGERRHSSPGLFPDAFCRGFCCRFRPFRRLSFARHSKAGCRTLVVAAALDILREQHGDKLVALNLDQALRVCASAGGARRCYDRPDR